jgi:cobalt/nickel transport system permease protein
MKAGFLDHDDGLNSPLHRLDPRTKLLLFFSAVVIVASEPSGEVAPFPYYYAAVGALALVARVPASRLAKRCLAAAPFLLMAAALPWTAAMLGDATSGLDPALFGASVLLRGFAAIILLVLLTSTSAFHRLLWGLRKLRIPEALSQIVTLMYRQLFILADEWRRAGQARDCRSAGRLNLSPLSVYGKQLGVIFLRSWDRADRVHAAMLVRGFDGRLPLSEPSRVAKTDLAALGLTLAVFLFIRTQL